MGPFDEGKASVESHGAKRFDFEIANCRDTGVEKPQDDMDPRGLGMDGAKLVRRGVDNVAEEAASGLDLNARGRGVIVANAVDGLSNERVEGLVVGHELTGLSFARLDGRVNDRGGVQHGASLEGGDSGHELRDGEGLARQEGLAHDMIRDGKKRAWIRRGKEGAIEGECGSVRVREGCR